MKKIKISNNDTNESIIVKVEDDDLIEIERYVTKYAEDNLDWNLDEVRYEILGESEESEESEDNEASEESE